MTAKNPDAPIQAQQVDVGSIAEGSRLSSGFDSVVQAGMMFLQANVMRSAYNVSKRYYNIAAADDTTWQTLYVPVMSQFVTEMFLTPPRPLDNAFFRARSLVPAATIQKKWYNARLMTSRYSYGAREDMDYNADISARWTRVNSAYVGLSLAESYFETYKEQRRMHMAQAVQLGKQIQTGAMSSMAQAVDLQSRAATDTIGKLSKIGATVSGGIDNVQTAAANVIQDRNMGMVGDKSIGQRGFGGQLAVALGFGKSNYTNNNLSNNAMSVTGSGAAQ
jgi:hypothetical protein